MYIDVRCIMNDVLFYDGVNDGVNVLMLYWNVFIFIFYCYYVWICYFNVVSLYYD
jgi:hypothetical protein